MITHKHKLNDFLKLAKAKHGNKFNYDKVQYINSQTNIIIVCPKHGEFSQRPSNHLHGRGCRKCKKSAKSSKPKTTSQFIKDAQLKHGMYYDYSKVEYKNSTIKVNIICPKHGEFEQSPSNHLRGSGCKKCGSSSGAEKQKDTIESFIEKANKIHNNFYSYDKAIYKTARLGIDITCPSHGEFTQLPTNHLKGVGCPGCNGGIFNAVKPTVLYYLSVNNGEAYKLGITSKTITTRFDPSDVIKIEVLYTYQFKNGRDAYNTEQSLLKEFEKYKYIGKNLLKSGNTELFNKNILKYIKEKLQDKI